MMMTWRCDVVDVSDLIKAKSDQLNADDLMGGDVVVTIKDVKRVSGDQPLSVALSGGHMPWRPCKTSIRILAYCWGKDASKWIGRRVQLTRDESVKWAGREVGGIRPVALSHLDKPVTLALQVRRGEKRPHTIRPLPNDAPDAGKSTADLEALLEEAGVTVAALDAWLVDRGRDVVADLDDHKRAALGAWLAGKPDVLASLSSRGGEE